MARPIAATVEDLAHEVLTAAYEERFEALLPLAERLEQEWAWPCAQPSRLLALPPAQQQAAFWARDIARTVRLAAAKAQQGDVASAQAWAYCYAYNLLVPAPAAVTRGREWRFVDAEGRVICSLRYQA